MKSNILDFTRLMLAFRKFAIERKRTLLFEFLGCAAIIFGILSLSILSNGMPTDFQDMLFKIGFVVVAITASTRSFNQLQASATGMFYLMLPISRMEKLLVAVLLASIIYPMAYTVVFMMVDYLFYFIVSVAIGGVHFAPYSIFETYYGDLSSMIRNVLTYQAVFLLGSIWFRRNSFLKTSSFIVLYFIAATVILAMCIIPNVMDSKLYGNTVVYGGNQYVNIFPSNALESFFGTTWSVLGWLLPFFFWTVAYFRLSEKQI